MQISSRFTIALHIFTCVEVFGDKQKVTSDFLAASINTNPVVIRKILIQLRNAGLITVARGTGDLIRQHNNANVLVMPGRFIDEEMARKIMDEYFNTEFEGGRHQKRIDKIPV